MSVKKFKLPNKGLSEKDLFNEMKEKRKEDARWQEGKTFSLVFYPGAEALSVLKKAYLEFFSENALNPTAFPSLRQMETEVVAMTANLFNPTGKTAGSMTSGGTESILLAIKTCRDYYRKKRPDITEPEVVMPTSAHPAFDKGFHYFGLKVVKVPVKNDYLADAKAMESAITKNTIMIIGSAVSYPQGVVDPIKELSKIAQKHKLWLHVDACIGGLVLAFKRQLGKKVPDFDFKLPGVHSLSVDLHKYGYAAKGASVILYKDSELRRHQFFVTTDWPGGIYPSPTVTGTRPGGAIAAAWAIMKFLGVDGYKKLTRDLLDTTDSIKDAVAQIPGVKILGEPAMTIMGMGSDELDVYQIGDHLLERGWMLDRQQNPACLHLTISPAHIEAKERFIQDLRWAVDEARKSSAGKKMDSFQVGLVSTLARVLPKPVTTKLMKAATKATTSKGGAKKSAAMYGMMGALPNKGDVKEMVLTFMDKMFSP